MKELGHRWLTPHGTLPAIWLSDKKGRNGWSELPHEDASQDHIQDRVEDQHCNGTTWFYANPANTIDAGQIGLGGNEFVTHDTRISTNDNDSAYDPDRVVLSLDERCTNDAYAFEKEHHAMTG
jgi:hypothetical protein